VIVENGLITQLSVSQVESFDPKQPGGCPRRWWFERAQDLRPDQTRQQSDGEAGHALLAAYFATGERPKGRVKMGKAVTGAILKGDLPTPGPDLLVEQRFSGQEKLDAAGNWIPLDVAETLHVGGVPWEGFIDLAFRRGDVPEIWDHKFLSDLAYAKKPSDLIRTVQLPVYVFSQLPYWPDAKTWRIAHHNVSKRGVDSCVRSALVSLDDVHERIADVESIVAQMRGVAPLENQSDVPHARRPGYEKNPCDAWTGCPHQSICSAFRSSTAVKGATPVQLTPEEAAILGDLDGVELDVVPPAAPVAPPPPAAPKPRARLNVVDVNMCVCGAEITDANGSQLRSGHWLHIDCAQQAKQRADAQAKLLASPAPAPVVVQPPIAPAQIPVAVLPPDAPVSKPELASEQSAPPKEPKARRPRAQPAPGASLPAPLPAQIPDSPRPAPAEPAPVPAPRPTPPIPARVDLSPNVALATEFGRNFQLVPPAKSPRAAALADVLRSIASLLET
jgi:hypothetical protein